MTKEQVIHDVLAGGASRPRSSSPPNRWRRWRCFSAATNAAQITGANLSIDGGWTAE